MTIRSRLLSIALAVFIAAAFMPLLPNGSVYGTGSGLEKEDYYFYANGEDFLEVEPADPSNEIIGADIRGDQSIAEVTMIQPGYVIVKAKHDIGECTLVVHFKSGRDGTATIHVTHAYMNQRLYEETVLDGSGYGADSMTIYSWPGTSGSISVGGEAHRFSVPDSGEAKVKINKIRKIGTKITISIGYGKARATINDTITAYVRSDDAKGSKKKIRVCTFNLHKGDVVRIKYKGKTYKKTMKKDYSYSLHWVVFKVKKKVSQKKAAFTLTIHNKFKQKMLTHKVILKKGRMVQD